MLPVKTGSVLVVFRQCCQTHRETRRGDDLRQHGEPKRGEELTFGKRGANVTVREGDEPRGGPQPRRPAETGPLPRQDRDDSRSVRLLLGRQAPRAIGLATEGTNDRRRDVGELERTFIGLGRHRRRRTPERVVRMSPGPLHAPELPRPRKICEDPRDSGVAGISAEFHQRSTEAVGRAAAADSHPARSSTKNQRGLRRPTRRYPRRNAARAVRAAQ